MPSSADPVADALRAAADAVADAVRDHRDVAAVVLIDGRSGSGKSTLAARVAAAWPWRVGADVLALDSVYPGWDGLAAGAAQVRDRVLRPRAEGVRAAWHRWDWVRDRAAEEHVVDPGRGLIVEGVGALDADTAPLAPIRVWLESPADARRDRALARDGDAFRPHWERWARQEEVHLAAHAPASFATHVFAVP
ncbi:hypothetical protein [Microbacterium sp.]|uniref:hypothetical protein n=1 Tax=Microbacterium sp. TaxID=51671 RepID=UPI003A83657C